MDSLMLQKLKEFLGKSENIGVVVGKNPTLDEMGAALALYLSLNESGKKTSVVSPTLPTVEISSLVGIDKVKSNFETASGDLTVSFPYREGEIEKISYTLDNGLLNIIVKAGEKGLSFNEKEVKYKRAGKAPQVIFVVGTPRLTDLGTIYDTEALKDTFVINIDNKESNQGFGDVVMVSRQFSSVSESVANLITSLNLNLDIDIAQNLLSGICSATNNFQSPNTSPLAFETGATLMKKGAKRLAETAKSRVRFIEPDQFIEETQPTNNASVNSVSLKQSVSSEDKKDDNKNPPEDWLAPKIYKGSTAI